LLDWVERAPEHKAFFLRTTHLWQLAGKVEDNFRPDVDNAWQRFQRTVKPTETLESSPKPEAKVVPLGRSAGRVQRLWWSAAAALVVLLGVGYWLGIYEKTPKTLAFASGGRRMEHRLPDGTRVTLNRNSRLSYAEGLRGDQRVVTLQGEAFFDVRRNPDRPFVIYTAQSRVEVLGTSFTVRDDTLRQTAEVQVVTGLVAFSSRNPADTVRLRLRPGFKGVLNAQQQLAKLPIDDPNFMAWQSDKLVFNNASLRSVVVAMENYFDVDIEVTDPQLYDCRYTGDFEKPALEHVLQVVTLATNLNYKNQSGRYVLYGGGCSKK
jgi:ferric-dicitrate binding protein FerR (iron transport regulator)